MAVKIDFDIAEENLLKALRNKEIINDELGDLISLIINGSHKTYKYILMTGLLAKSVCNDVSSLALQAGAPLAGAYDARSLCHKVVVPFERDFLQNSLGGSNEPFLNKPARFTHLSTDNAVRRGKDQETLNNLIRVFENIKTSSEAIKYLSHALAVLDSVIVKLKKLHNIDTDISLELIDIYAFILKFTEQSFEGETCTIVVGAIEKQFYSNLGSDYKVIPHKINQSGASSKEIGDIDIFYEKKYLYSIEIKDKAFTVYDLEHAFNKIIENNGDRGAFLYGPRADFDQDSIKIKLFNFEKEKFVTLFMDVLSYSKMMLFKMSYLNYHDFIKEIMDVAILINAKEETKEWVKNIQKEITSK